MTKSVIDKKLATHQTGACGVHVFTLFIFVCKLKQNKPRACIKWARGGHAIGRCVTAHRSTPGFYSGGGSKRWIQGAEPEDLEA